MEKTYYPLIARWMKRHFLCFKVAVNKGLRYGRIDVTGIRDVGGDLSGEVETIAVEVKRGATPFANACGQAFGYRVYANRVYLADVREERFTQDEIFIASNLGIGLIQIRGKKCGEVLSSPFYRPIARMQLRLFEALRLGKCQLCDSLFQIGAPEGEGHLHSNLTREKIKFAIEQGKGLMFWNREVADRKRRLGIRETGDYETFERRFICPDCVWYLLSQLSPEVE